ncbi:MAG: DUF2339 domain-containing protein [Pirellulales bacterium]
MPDEILIMMMVCVAVVALVLAPLVVSIVALVRSHRIKGLLRRVEQLEAALRAQPGVVVGKGLTRPETGPATPPEQPVIATPQEVAQPAGPILVELVSEPSLQVAGGLEFAIGRKVLGWAAVIVLLFAAAFFVRYAFQNQWIGPVGRVALGAVTGLALVAAGRWYHAGGWRNFSQMLTAGGVVLLYLATYSAFGFYHLVPQQTAALFLMLVIAESAILAVQYDAPAIALMALVGGLLTPVLMRSEHDQYKSLFIYLGVLDAGVVLLVLRRYWRLIGTVAFAGTQGLFWSWYAGNYHPEKLAWALGFQAAVYVVFLAHSLVAHVFQSRRAGWDDLARLLLNALFGFLAAYVLLREDYPVWMGTLAVSMAAVYALLARLMLALRPDDERQLLVALAISVSFIALAFPIQASAEWVALGWAAEAAALWWFGLRVQAPALRGLAAVLASLAATRLALFDMPHGTRDPFVPVFNEYALPALGVTACLLGALASTRRFLARITRAEQVLVGAAAVACVLLLWMVLSVDLHGFFQAQEAVAIVNVVHWDLLGAMSLSALWAVYATVLLAVGFRTRLALLRWTALGLYALTIGKVFLSDMAGLKEFYRILAFFILAILLGVAAWAYQRMRPELEPPVQSKGTES